MVRAYLTGGIGSGKTAVAAILQSFGAAVISSDAAGHAVLEPGGTAFDAVGNVWPQALRDGRIDRAALASIVFADPGELAALESITHPAIGEMLRAQATSAKAAVVLVEIPLLRDLVGDSWPRVVVDAPIEVRVARLRLRGMDGADIVARMSAQPSRDEWLSAADLVLDNGGDRVRLERSCRSMWERVVTSGSVTPPG